MNKKVQSKLSEKIRYFILESEVTMIRLCEMTNIDKACLSRFMSGKKGLELANLEAIADLIGLYIAKDENHKIPAKLFRKEKPGRKSKNGKHSH